MKSLSLVQETVVTKTIELKVPKTVGAGKDVHDAGYSCVAAFGGGRECFGVACDCCIYSGQNRAQLVKILENLSEEG